jgi:hypothetical protein
MASMTFWLVSIGNLSLVLPFSIAALINAQISGLAQENMLVVPGEKFAARTVSLDSG